MNFYNEIDLKAAAWLRELITAGLIPQGDVDERDIRDIRPDELAGYTQCHFFAGIGGWSRALELAGWPPDRPVWTGSCPCQPFSAAGRGAGVADERHLWPHWFHLISQCQPAVVFGEQVASKDGLGWLDLVCADMEGAGYAIGAADMCAAGLGAPHIRQRLWFVGVADASRLGRAGREGATQWREHDGQDAGWQQGHDGPVGGDQAGVFGLADAEQHHRGSQTETPDHREQEAHRPADWRSRRSVPSSGLADTDSVGTRRGLGDDAEAAGLPKGERQPEHGADVSERGSADHDGRGDVRGDGVSSHAARPSPTDGFWRDADWLFCRDGKWRPVEPGTFPLAHGLPARVGRLRGYGNAISPVVGAAFIEAAMISLA